MAMATCYDCFLFSSILLSISSSFSKSFGRGILSVEFVETPLGVLLPKAPTYYIIASARSWLRRRCNGS